MKMRITKAKSCLVRCSRIVGKTWGISPKHMLWVYQSVIRPMVAFASSVWVPALDLSTIQNGLSRIQRLACVCVTSAFPGTPTAALEMLLGLPPLHLFLKAEAILASYRLKCNGQWWGNKVKDTDAHRSHVIGVMSMCATA